jgi:hypothetical protein
MPVNKNIWLDQIMENFYPQGDFLTQSVDMSENVEYNKINLAEAGVDPAVLLNNNTYPIATAQRNDNTLELPLATLDTENTLVRNVEEKEASYNKMESVLRGHRNSLQAFCRRYAAHGWAPQANGTFTPVQATSGATADGFKKASFEDFLKLEAAFRDLDVDLDQLNVVIPSRMLADLRSEDLKLFKEVMSDNKLFSFKMHTFTRTPLFTSAGAKKPWGAARVATDSNAAVAWVSTEVMRADGTVDMFATYKDPGQRGDIVGFQKRFLALPIRGKYIGALYSGV